MKWILAFSALILMNGPFENLKTDTLKPGREVEAHYRKGKAFTAGEYFAIKIYYNWSALWVASGEVQFRIAKDTFHGREAFRLMANGRTYKAYDRIYSVNDRYESYIDANTLLPLKAEREINEGNYWFRDEYHFDWHEQIVKVKNYKNGKEGEISLEKKVMDVLSAVYMARNIDYDQFQIGDVFRLPVFVDEEIYEIKIRYGGRKDLKTRTGRYKTFVLYPYMLDNEYFDENDHMTIYVSDDQNRIPVRLESPLTVGSIKADIKSYGGLKYPFEARLE